MTVHAVQGCVEAETRLDHLGRPNSVVPTGTHIKRVSHHERQFVAIAWGEIDFFTRRADARR